MAAKEWETKNSLITPHVAYHYSSFKQQLDQVKIHVSLSACPVVVVASRRILLLAVEEEERKLNE